MMPRTHPFFTVATLALLAGALVPMAPAESLLDLGDGNFIRGKPGDVKDGTLSWHHSASGAEMRFPLAGVRRLVFASQPPPNPNGDILLLDNGDMVAGDLLSLDQEKAVVRSPLAGELPVPRARLRTARLAPSAQNLVYADAGDLAGWKSSAENGRPVRWTARDGVLHYKPRGGETIARDVKLPPAADIAFDVAWDTNKSQPGMGGAMFSVLICADHDRPGDTANGYSLNFNMSWLTVQRVGTDAAGRKNNTLGRIQLANHLDGSQMLRVRVVANRPGKRLHIFLNGREAGEMQDDSDEAPPGSYMHFSGDGANPFRIRNLTVESWNGLVGNKLASTTKTGHQRDLVLTVDGDEIFGTIQAIRADASQGRVVDLIIPLNQSKPMVVPVAVIRHVSFARPSDAAPGEAQTVVTLDDGSRLSGKLDGFDGETLRLAFLGQTAVSVPVAHLLAVDFSPATGGGSGEAASGKGEKTDMDVEIIEE